MRVMRVDNPARRQAVVQCYRVSRPVLYHPSYDVLSLSTDITVGSSRAVGDHHCTLVLVYFALKHTDRP